MEERSASAFADSWEQSDSLDALRELTELAARIRPLVAKRAGLGTSELAVLEHLSRMPLGPAEIARLLEVSTAAATGIVDRLQARGHVERRAHSEDRRRTGVHLTASGREEVLNHLLPMFLALKDLDDAFDESERAIVARYLHGALDAFRSVTDPPPPN